MPEPGPFVTDSGFDLDRFVTAQDSDGTFDRVLSELRDAMKATHWMWFVFPQVAGLGHSPTAQQYAVSGLDEARAYLAHPVLGPRLRECCAVLLGHRGSTAEQIFGHTDAMKLRSSMTLFHRADPDQVVFPDVVERYFGGIYDDRTDELLD